MAKKRAASIHELMESSKLYRWRRLMRVVPSPPRCIVNTVEHQAGPGQLVLSERVYGAVKEGYPEAERVELELKGSAPVA